jgi:hypothetical protein
MNLFRRDQPTLRSTFVGEDDTEVEEMFVQAMKEETPSPHLERGWVSGSEDDPEA